MRLKFKSIICFFLFPSLKLMDSNFLHNIEADDLIVEKLATENVSETITDQEDSDDDIPINIRLPSRYRKRNTKADDGNSN